MSTIHSEELYKVLYPKKERVPILVSVPHAGIYIPDEIKNRMDPHVLANCTDADWLIDHLYDFVTESGITVIVATHHRWVVDLNRDPQGQALYNDGRLITGLVPLTNFRREQIYRDEPPDEAEIKRRIEKYFRPYHDKIRELLSDLKQQFGQVLLWDAHSINQRVGALYSGPFPDLILGTADGESCSSEIIAEVWDTLRKSSYSTALNRPFSGGYITRHFGMQSKNQFALQLEMTKVNYLNNGESAYDDDKAAAVRELLREIFTKIITKLT